MISPGWERERDPKAKRPVHYSFNRYSYLDSVRRLKRQEQWHRHGVQHYRSRRVKAGCTGWACWKKLLYRAFGKLREVLGND